MASGWRSNALAWDKYYSSFVRPMRGVRCLHKARLDDPLRDEDHIRLLKLYPPGWPDRVHRAATRHTTDPIIKCDVYQAALEDLRTEGLPYYSALSYAWGNPERYMAIQCDGQDLKIPRNLYDALTWVRLRFQPMLLWVDAICISDDQRERSSQVQRMRYVYEQAHVVAWLGNEFDAEVRADQVDKAVEIIGMLAALPGDFTGDLFVPEVTVRKLWVHHGHQAADLDNLPWRGLSRLYNNAYFRRLWIVQELALAHSLVFRVGPFSLNRRMMLRGHQMLEDFVRPKTERQRRISHVFMSGVSSLLQSSEGFSDTLRTVSQYSGQECSNPRDHIYGLAALFKGPVSSYPVDYSLSPQKVFIDFAVSYIRASGNLDILSEGQRPNIARKQMSFDTNERRNWTPGLPSWCPDWAGPLNYHRGLDIMIYHASGNHHVEPVIVGSNGLSLRGLSVCRITSLSDKLDGVYGDSHLDHLKAIRSAERVVLKLISTVPASDLWKSYLDVLTAGTNHLCSDAGTQFVATGMTTQNAHHFELLLPNVALQDRPRVAMERFGPSWLATFSKRMLASAGLHVRKDAGSEHHQKAKIMRHIIQRSSWATRLFITDKSMLGTAPDGARVGDLVCVLYGGKVPFILRHVGNKGHFILIGEAYVHGIMHGEALKMGREERVFTLI